MAKNFTIDFELIQRFRSGDETVFPILWNKVKGLVYQKARKILSAKINTGLELCDLEQAGRIALFETIKRYDPDWKNESFTQLFLLRLNREFAIAAGYYTSRTKNDLFRTAVSLDQTITNSEGDEVNLYDLLPDPDSEQPFLDAEKRVWNQELHKVLQGELSKLKGRRADVIRERYFNGKTRQQIANEYRCSVGSIYQLETSALEQLEHKRGLQAFLDERTNFARHTTLNGFKRTHTSSVERLVMEREELSRSYWKKDLNHE